jgi:hypothetical protein
MGQTRRSWLATFAGASILVAGKGVISLGAQVAQPIPSPNAPNQNAPSGLDGPQATKDSDNHPIDPNRERKLREDADRLYMLALDLRTSIWKSDVRSTLSLAVVNKAHEVEKLAKEIRSLSR